MRALVVDDSRLIRLMNRTILEEIGFDVTEAADAAEAEIQFESEGPFDVALIDTRLPDSSGSQLVQNLRSVDLDRQTVILMVTAASQEDDARHAVELGADGYLFKPLEPEQLTARLGDLRPKVAVAG